MMKQIYQCSYKGVLHITKWAFLLLFITVSTLQLNAQHRPDDECDPDKEAPKLTCPLKYIVNVPIDRSPVYINLATFLEDELITVKDNCDESPNLSIIEDQQLTFSCEDFNPEILEPKTLIIEATDAAGKKETCKINLQLVPEVNCEDHLTVNAGVVINPSDLIADSPICEYIDFSIDYKKALCGDVGKVIEVTLSIDYSEEGSEDICTVPVTIKDGTSLSCMSNATHTVRLDNNGEGSIDPDILGPAIMVEVPTCSGEVDYDFSHTSFLCHDIGERVVSVKASIGDRSTTCQVTVNVVDRRAPRVQCNTPLTIALNELGKYSLTIAEVLKKDFPTDNCTNAQDIDLFFKVFSEEEEMEVEVDVIEYTCDDIKIYDFDDFDDFETEESELPISFHDRAVTLFARDASGNIGHCNSTIILIDDMPPFIDCKDDITVEIGEDGAAVAISHEDIFVGEPEDNCTEIIYSISQDDFDCHDVIDPTDPEAEPIKITLSAYDLYNNTSECQVYVTVLDKIAPEVKCEEGPIVLFLDGDGNAELRRGMVNDGSSDNCSLSLSLSRTDFYCSDVGATQSVVLTGTDDGGNTDECTISVIVREKTSPIVACNHLDVILENGAISISPEDLLNTEESTFSCGIFSKRINEEPTGSDITLTCEDFIIIDEEGEIVEKNNKIKLALTVADRSGQQSSCAAWVTIKNEPLAKCKDHQEIVLDLDEDGIFKLDPALLDKGSYGSCIEGLELSIEGPHKFDCDDIYDEKIDLTLVVTDLSGLTDFCETSIKLVDGTDPIAKCREEAFNATVGAEGSIHIDPSYINAGSTDDCGIDSYIVNPNKFSCSDFGSHKVTLTVTDKSGNSSTCESTINVTNESTPTIKCVETFNIVLETVPHTLDPLDLLVSRTSLCQGALTFELSQSDFTCENIGEDIEVQVTATAPNGEIDWCKTTITVEDGEKPALVCKTHFDAVLDAWGKGIVTVGDIVESYSDNCDEELEVDEEEILQTFGCSDVGKEGLSVTYSLMDKFENEAECETAIKVIDNTAPEFVSCPEDITLSPELGLCYIRHSWKLPEATDKCGIASLEGVALGLPVELELSEDGSTVSGEFAIGINTIKYTAIDNNGNEASCEFQVTVEDKHPPTFLNCPSNTEVYTEPGECFALVAFLKLRTDDNCTIAKEFCTYLFPDGTETIFTSPPDPSPIKFPIGTTIVSHEVFDRSNNQAECRYEITVKDNEKPTLVFNNYSLTNSLFGYKDGDEVILPHGTAITYSERDVTESDNCEVNVTFEDTPIDINCEEHGFEKAFKCVWTATDASGNSSTLTLYIKVECPLDVAPNIFVNRGRFFSNFVKDQEKDFIIILEEKNGTPTEEHMEFFITTTDGFSYTFPPSHATANNSDWEATPNPSSNLILFKCKPGVSIPGYGSHEILIKVKALIPGAAANTTTRLFPKSGGDSDGTDNVNIIDFSIQN